MLKVTTFNGAKNTPLPPPPPPPPPPLLLRTRKMDNLQDWISNPATVISKIATARTQGYNGIQFYGLYSIFQTPLESFLPSLISQCYAAGFIFVGGIMGAGIAGFQLMLDYNATQSSAATMFNDFNKENEFWNYPGNGEPETFALWIDSIAWLYSQIDHATQIISAYIQNYSVPVWGSSEAGEMVQYINHLECTSFTTDPYETGVSNTIFQLIAAAAAAIIKVQKIQPLISAEPNYSGPYLAANGLSQFESAFNAQYSLDTMPNKTSLNLIGYNYFDDHFLVLLGL